MKLRIQLVLLSAAGVVCGVLLAETGLRFASPTGITFVVQWGAADDAIERRANQASREPYGTITFDESGFRVGSGLPYDRSILFIGDSFTEGRGVSDDETFARTTERALRRDGFMVRSLNAGHRGFGAAQESQGAAPDARPASRGRDCRAVVSDERISATILRMAVSELRMAGWSSTKRRIRCCAPGWWPRSPNRGCRIGTSSGRPPTRQQGTMRQRRTTHPPASSSNARF